MDWNLVLLGALGGALPDVIRQIQGRHKNEMPDYYKHVNFWLGFGLLVVLGAAAPLIGQAKDAQSALAMGYAAPELVSRLLAGKAARLGPAGVAGRFAEIRRWWRF